MTKKEIFELELIKLAAAYPNQKVSRQNVQAISHFVGKTIGFNHDWEKILAELASSQTFFPNPAAIIAAAKKNNCDSESLAFEALETFIGYLNGSLSREQAGLGFVSYWQNKFNVDKYSVSNGNVDLNFKRKVWLEEMTREYSLKNNEEYIRTNQLQESNESTNINKQITTLNNVMKTAENKTYK